MVEDYWSIKNDTPKVDETSHLTGTYEISADKEQVTFVSRRKLDTGEYTEDYLVKLDEEMEMVWAINHKTGEWVNHTFRGGFKMTLDETLGNPPAL